ncbi:MAG: hypothetical protein RIA69_05725 [Cyclobacteriaceae bacterium]
MNLGVGSRIRNEELGVGVVIQSRETEVLVTFVSYGVEWVKLSEIEKDYTVLEAVKTPADLVSLSQIEDTIKSLLSDILDQDTLVDLGEKWEGGKLIFQPRNPTLKSYELPIDTFFHKIVMVRDRLRVMEQRINCSKLTDEEKVNLQQYITKIYGSLTSFNVLFRSRESGFIGESK